MKEHIVQDFKFNLSAVYLALSVNGVHKEALVSDLLECVKEMDAGRESRQPR